MICFYPGSGGGWGVFWGLAGGLRRPALRRRAVGRRDREMEKEAAVVWGRLWRRFINPEINYGI